VPLTVTGTLKLASEFNVLDAGETVTMGVNRAAAVTITDVFPLATAYSESPL